MDSALEKKLDWVSVATYNMLANSLFSSMMNKGIDCISKMPVYLCSRNDCSHCGMSRVAKRVS